MCDLCRWEFLDFSDTLKVGEDLFKAHAKLLKKYGAPVVVMTFDQEGQAATALEKVCICKDITSIYTN